MDKALAYLLGSRTDNVPFRVSFRTLLKIIQIETMSYKNNMPDRSKLCWNVYLSYVRIYICITIYRLY